jgi:hypothetical protein
VKSIVLSWFNLYLFDICFSAGSYQLLFSCSQTNLDIISGEIQASSEQFAKVHLFVSRSLFERLEAAGCHVFPLEVQYRMHPQISHFPSKHFYQNAYVLVLYSFPRSLCFGILPVS